MRSEVVEIDVAPDVSLDVELLDRAGHVDDRGSFGDLDLQHRCRDVSAGQRINNVVHGVAGGELSP
jgi:hypothetical protein